VPLKLCECERATGAPNGLSCDKEGFFLSSFERQGQWVAGGGYVPLSNAICCRPCLPDELPPDTSGRITPGQKPLGIISLGCHTSTEPLGVRCEAGGQSFVSGFADAIKVYTASETYYPVDSAQVGLGGHFSFEGWELWALSSCFVHAPVPGIRYSHHLSALYSHTDTCSHACTPTLCPPQQHPHTSPHAVLYTRPPPGQRRCMGT
jgi:hypothetical protein